MIDSIAALAPGVNEAPSKRDDPASIQRAAQQFEALLIGELLKTSHAAGESGWLGTGGDDEAGEIGVEQAEQEFARALSSGGGLGMAKMIANGLRQEAAASQRKLAGATADSSQ